MKDTYISKLTKNSWFMFWTVIILLLFLVTNLPAIAWIVWIWIMWYWSDGDYNNPSISLSWSIQVWTWETLTWAVAFNTTQAINFLNGSINVIIPNGTEITNSTWTWFNITEISTSVLTSLPIAIASNEEEIWKIYFWINWLKLNFSKPVKLQIPVNTTKSTVKIKAKHFWIDWYQTFALTDTLGSSCNNWYASPTANTANVVNWIATIYTCSASSFVAVTDKNVVIVSTWGWSSGGGWGGWSLLSRDNCPNWDFSPSYYDRKCWATPVVYVDKDSTKTGSLVYTDETPIINNTGSIINWKKIKLTYKWIDILVIDWYAISKKTAIVAKKIIDNNKISFEKKENYVKRLNEFLLSKYEIDTQNEKLKKLKNKYIKQYFLLRSLHKEIINDLKS